MEGKKEMACLCNIGVDMRRDAYKLFSQGSISRLAVKNRIIRSATYEGGMTADGRISSYILNLYKNLAYGGVGAIITGHMAVRRAGKGHDRQICIYDDRHITEIAQIAEAVHGSGKECKVIAQLNYAGRQVLHDNTVAECVGPSDVPSPILRKRAKALDIDEIQKIIDSYAGAIVRVKKAGFDGAQLHGAHGYLLSSFLSPYTNRRHDKYGGSIEKRAAILKEIIEKARGRVDDFPILIKMNSSDHVEGGIDFDTFPVVAKKVESLGFDAIEVSGGMWDCLIRSEKELGFFPLPIPESRTRINSLEKQSYYVPAAERLDLHVPLIVAGGHRNVESLEEIINRGNIDFLSLSRPLISEPDLPNRWLEGRGSEKADCVSCNSCLLEVKSKPLKCVLKQNRFKQKIVKNLVPQIWKLIVK
jgi:2,4-dienoyl-CoA reductase-like NADH-dependent reductase (Old Yellow Enzyme family)